MPALRRRSSTATTAPEPTFPPAHDWRTTDDHERARRLQQQIEHDQNGAAEQAAFLGEDGENEGA